MFEVWTGDDDNAEALARRLEAHLNEFAADVVNVSYSVADKHYVMAVYRPIEFASEESIEAFVELAEEIVTDAQG